MIELKPYYEKQIFVCVNSRDPPEKSCSQKDSAEIHRLMKEYVKAQGLTKMIRVSKSYCQDLCSFGPVVSIYPDNTIYKQVTVNDVKKIIDTLV